MDPSALSETEEEEEGNEFALNIFFSCCVCCNFCCWCGDSSRLALDDEGTLSELDRTIGGGGTEVADDDDEDAVRSNAGGGTEGDDDDNEVDDMDVVVVDVDPDADDCNAVPVGKANTGVVLSVVSVDLLPSRISASRNELSRHEAEAAAQAPILAGMGRGRGGEGE